MECAIGLLARREHSRKELGQKLRARSFNTDCIDDVLDRLATDGLQSDQRYTESYLRSRIHKGYGPVRLGMELSERGIDKDMTNSCIDELDINWMETLNSVRVKKFGENLPKDFKGQIKESRFLLYRGFTSEQIRKLYKGED
jgi:regulatory protein